MQNSAPAGCAIVRAAGTDGTTHLHATGTDLRAQISPESRFGYRTVTFLDGDDVIGEPCATSADRAESDARRMLARLAESAQEESR